MNCPICGAVLNDNTPPDQFQILGGWLLCAEHKAFLKASRYESRCRVCYEPIQKNELIILVKLETWFVLHQSCLQSHYYLYPQQFNELVVHKYKSNYKYKKQHHRNQNSNIPNNNNTAYETLHLLDSAPLEVVTAAYRALSLLHHPDRDGGNEEKMKAINNAIDEIRKQHQG